MNLFRTLSLFVLVSSSAALADTVVVRPITDFTQVGIFRLANSQPKCPNCARLSLILDDATRDHAPRNTRVDVIYQGRVVGQITPEYALYRCFESPVTSDQTFIINVGLEGDMSAPVDLVFMQGEVEAARVTVAAGDLVGLSTTTAYEAARAVMETGSGHCGH